MFPLLFSAIQGQERPISVLRSALNQERVAHAYLFAGPDGVGKAMTASCLAAALMCSDGGTEACGACTSCRKIEGGHHPDFLWIEPEGAGQRVRIDRVRELVRGLSRAPYEGRYRVVVFPRADRLNEEAANALLKTLEEPPSGTIFVLVTSAPQGLVETIRSRCQELRFGPLPLPLCAELLVKEGLTADEARVAAALGEGSVGRSLDLARAGLLEQRAETLEALKQLDKRRPSFIFELATDWSTGENATAAREAVGRRLDLLATWFRDRLWVANGGAVDGLVHEDRGDELLAAQQSGASALRCLDHIAGAREALRLNAGARLTCERLFVLLAGELA